MQAGSTGESSCDREGGGGELNVKKSASLGDYLSAKSRIRVSDLREAKRRKEKWAMLTSYDSISARIFDKAGIPCLLVGDSAAQTVYGYKSTIPVSVDELIPLARAVSSSCERALVIADLPFGSYQESPEVALRTAIRFMKESMVHGVKLEGGKEYAKHVELLTQAGIPVMAHLGFTPQSEHALSGFKVQGREESAKARILNDALRLQEAGAFACVLELMPSETGRLVSDRLDIPTVGIGAGPDCDAQVMVWQDMAGFTAPKGATSLSYLGGVQSQTQNGEADSQKVGLQLNRVPKFVKKYANLSEILYEAAVSYANDVRDNVYPGEEHCYK